MGKLALVAIVNGIALIIALIFAAAVLGVWNSDSCNNGCLGWSWWYGGGASGPFGFAIFVALYGIFVAVLTLMVAQSMISSEGGGWKLVLIILWVLLLIFTFSDACAQSSFAGWLGGWWNGCGGCSVYGLSVTSTIIMWICFLLAIAGLIFVIIEGPGSASEAAKGVAK